MKALSRILRFWGSSSDGDDQDNSDDVEDDYSEDSDADSGATTQD